MGYHAERTPILLDALRKEPEAEFTASQLKDRTRVPKKFVRRALTVDGESVAEAPMDGVEMRKSKEDGLWRFRVTRLDRSN